MNTKELDERAYVTEVDGKLVLIDPVAYAVIKAVNKSNCENTYIAQMDLVEYFQKRILEKDLDPRGLVIVLINVDSLYGFEIAEVLMPGHDWQQYREKGEVPFARGLAIKGGIANMIAIFDKEASDKILSITNIPVVVLDYDVVEIFSV